MQKKKKKNKKKIKIFQIIYYNIEQLQINKTENDTLYMEQIIIKKDRKKKDHY